MLQEQLDRKLAEACDRPIPDFAEISELILAGADTNQLDRFGDSIFDSVFIQVLYYRANDEDVPEKEKQKVYDDAKSLVALMAEHGWDTRRYGLAVMEQLAHSFYDHSVFDLAKSFLRLDLGNDQQAYESLLEGFGTAESYQRCCEQDHEAENLFYTIYEMVEAKRNGNSYEGIELYREAVGRTIDRIVYFNESDTTVAKGSFTEFYADIGFACGDKMLVLRDGINILLMNDRAAEVPQIDFSDAFGENTVGEKIISISFDHKSIVKGNTRYGQPIIIIELANGKKLKFSHNFGEQPDRPSRSRFWTE